MKLSKSQLAEIEKNHDLIYGFINSRKLDLSEHYGLIAESLMKAVYAHKPNLGSLSTLFNSIARNDLGTYYKKKKEIGQLGSSDDLSICVEHNDDLYWVETDIYNKLTKEDQVILGYLLKSYTQREISDFMGLTRSSVNRKVMKLKKELVRCLGS